MSHLGKEAPFKVADWVCSMVAIDSCNIWMAAAPFFRLPDGILGRCPPPDECFISLVWKWPCASSELQGTSRVFIRSKVQGCSKSPFWPAPRRFNAAWYPVATTKLNVEVFYIAWFCRQRVCPQASPMNTFCRDLQLTYGMVKFK